MKPLFEKLWPCGNNQSSGTKDIWYKKLCILMIDKHEHIGVGAYSHDSAHACWKFSGWQNNRLEGTREDRKLN